ncbi:VgrG-related protein [Streptomyces seoulensis]|uniref:Type IV secretion protein Rhs n=1 Tax=Streptomyces seoulensis TaxID=73044 RepID=A0A4P6TPX8_STRSO|nr:VgrG-related protein [Streptomyces seoulensis]QBJ89349.1 type IV secretion protein Rhs [Streptomyces seoulensis]
MTAAESGDVRSFAADPVVEAPGELPKTWATQLVSCVIEESVGLPDTAVLTYRDPQHEFLAATGVTIGTPLKVSVVTVKGQASEPLFSGEVTALELDRDGTGTFTVVRAYSKAHRLQRGRKVVAYRDMTTAAIIRKVVTSAGLACGKVEAPAVTHKQLSQANVSDWDFLQYLAGECGAQVRVDDKGVVQFTRPVKASGAPSPSTPATRSPLVLEYGRNLLALRASLSMADAAQKVQVRGWDATTKRAVVAEQASITSGTVVPGLNPASVNRFGKKTQVTVADTPYRTQAEAAAVARATAEQVSASYGDLEALTTGNPALRAGKAVALGNVGPAFSGRYTATAVQHVLEPHGGYRTTLWVSSRPDPSLTGLSGAGAGGSRGARIPGLAIGVVTDVREPNGAEQGAVRLKFPWLDDTYVSDWTRTVQWGGKGGGGVVSPEVNDEVLVGFEQGLLDSPYVLGGLYNGVDKPSKHDVPLIDKTSGKVNRRSVVSRSGHRLELLDAPRPGPSGLRLVTADKRLEVRMDDREDRIEVTVYRSPGQVGTSMVLDKQDITLSAPRGEVTLKGRRVTIDGQSRVSVSGRAVAVTGRSSVEVDGGLLGVLKAKLIRIN